MTRILLTLLAWRLKGLPVPVRRRAVEQLHRSLGVSRRLATIAASEVP